MKPAENERKERLTKVHQASGVRQEDQNERGKQFGARCAKNSESEEAPTSASVHLFGEAKGFSRFS
jgi:hypothetical protein